MLDQVDIRDQLFSLCNVVCQTRYDSVLRQSCALITEYLRAHSSVLFLLDSSGQNFIVSSGVTLGDTLWAPESRTVPLTASPTSICPLSQVAITGQPLLLDTSSGGYDLTSLRRIFGGDISPLFVIPLFKDDGNLLGIMAISGGINSGGLVSDSMFRVLVRTIAAILEQRINDAKLRTHKNALTRSLTNADRERDQLRKSKMHAIEERLAGSSAVMRDIRAKVLKLANFTDPLTVFGPDGCGKEKIANELHKASRYSQSPIVYIDSQQLTNDNFGPLFFGYRRGAIRGVSSSRRGYLQEAGEGMIFFDRIDLLAEALQIQLVRLLDTRVFRTIGGERDIPIKARFVFSSKQSLQANVDQGIFLAALKNKITRASLTITPLTERPEDIKHLVAQFLKTNSVKLRQQFQLTPQILPWLQQQVWSGNHRELEALLQRACIRANEQDGVITLAHLQEGDVPSDAQQASRKKNLKEMLQEFEKTIISNALKTHNQDRKEVAADLGIPKRTLADKCKKFQL